MISMLENENLNCARKSMCNYAKKYLLGLYFAKEYPEVKWIGGVLKINY